jgi:hypothetical protein
MENYYNAFADVSQPLALDANSVLAGIGYFDAKKAGLTDPKHWPAFRQSMVGLGFPQDWLPASFESPEQMVEFIGHVDRINSQIKKGRLGPQGDLPIIKPGELPVRPSTGLRYNPKSEFDAYVRDSYKMQIAPPASPDPKDILAWKVKNSAWMEQKQAPSFQKGIDQKTWGI